MPQPQHLVDVDAVVERERRRLRLRSAPRSSRATDLDLAGRQVGVDRAVGPGRTVAVDPHTHSLRTRCATSSPASCGIDDDLHEPGDVADVEEHHAAVVAPVRDPAAERDRRRRCRSARRSPARCDAHHDRCSRPSSCATTPRPPRAAPRPARRTRRSFTATMPRCASSAPSITPHVAPDAIGRRQLLLHRPAAVRAVGREPALAQLVRAARAASAIADEVDDEHVDAGRGRRQHALRRRTRAAAARCPMPNPIAGVGGPPISSASPS